LDVQNIDQQLYASAYLTALTKKRPHLTITICCRQNHQ